MPTAVLSELTTTLTVGHAVSSQSLLRRLARASLVLVQQAQQQGRLRGEVEIEHVCADTYQLTWKDMPTVSDDVKPWFPINTHPALGEGSGHYLSSETILGVPVWLARNCKGHTLAPVEVAEVLKYRLKCIDEELAELDAHFEPEDREADPQARKLLAVRDEYRWFLKLLAGPQRT